MKILALIIAVLGCIITIVFTIFPIGNLTVFPAFITIVCGFIVLKLYSQEGLSTKLPKILIGIAFVGALISMSRSVLTKDEVVIDTQFEQREEKSEQDAVKDLEDLEELENLDGL